MEKWGPNQNGDAFPLKELQSSYQTFKGKGNFIDHKSDDITKIRGLVVDAYMNNEDQCVECLIAVDKKSHPQLCRDIDTGTVNSVSMGTRVGWSECSVCGNIARTEDDYCQHIRNHKGQKFGSYVNNAAHRFGEWPVHEVNHQLEFIELSWVSVPAFKEANILERLASLNIKEEDKDILDINKNAYVDLKNVLSVKSELETIVDSARCQNETECKYDPRKIAQVETKTIPVRNKNYIDMALEAIDRGDEVCYDIASEYGQNFDNVKHMRWFIKAVAEQLEDDSVVIAKTNEVNMKKEAAGMMRIKITVDELTFRKNWKDYKATGKVSINEKDYSWWAFSKDKRQWVSNVDLDGAEQISAQGNEQIRNAISQLLNENKDNSDLIVAAINSNIKTSYLHNQHEDQQMNATLEERMVDEKLRKKPVYKEDALEIQGTDGKSSREIEQEKFEETAKEGPSGALGKPLKKSDEVLKKEELDKKIELRRAFLQYRANNKSAK
jgi:hypothetical protein